MAQPPIAFHATAASRPDFGHYGWNGEYPNAVVRSEVERLLSTLISVLQLILALI